MRMKSEKLLRPEYMSALNKLMKKEISAKQCLQLAKTAQEIDNQFKAIQKSRKIIIENYAVLDEDGKVKTKNNSTIIFKSKEDEEECKAKIIEMLEEEFEISLKEKIKMSAEEKFTTEEMVLLEDLIEIE